MDYYKKQFFLPQVNPEDKFLGQVERWSAHKKGICHRGFTTVLVYQHQVILQHRKHPAFDNSYDLSFSSHPVFINGKLQSMEESIIKTLKREWNLTKKDLKTDLKYLGKFYYKAKDPKSIYIEHEVDYLYLVELKKLPLVNKNFAYDFKLMEVTKILNTKYSILNTNFCPWVIKILEKNLIQPHLNFG